MVRQQKWPRKKKKAKLTRVTQEDCVWQRGGGCSPGLPHGAGTWSWGAGRRCCRGPAAVCPGPWPGPGWLQLHSTAAAGYTGSAVRGTDPTQSPAAHVTPMGGSLHRLSDNNHSTQNGGLFIFTIVNLTTYKTIQPLFGAREPTSWKLKRKSQYKMSSLEGTTIGIWLSV